MIVQGRWRRQHRDAQVAVTSLKQQRLVVEGGGNAEQRRQVDQFTPNADLGGVQRGDDVSLLASLIPLCVGGLFLALNSNGAAVGNVPTAAKVSPGGGPQAVLQI